MEDKSTALVAECSWGQRVRRREDLAGEKKEAASSAVKGAGPQICTAP